MPHTETETNGVLVHDFEDDETRAQLDLLDDLQKLGLGNQLHLPHLVVVGDQNTGKSSVLQAVTEIPFPMADGLCTRFATEIILRRTTDMADTTICIIPDEKLSEVEREGLREWKPKGWDSGKGLTQVAMRNIIDQAEEAIFGGEGMRNGLPASGKERKGSSGLPISGSKLQITRSGPKETNFAVVDLPGLVRESSIVKHEMAKRLVKKYLMNLRSIVVVVIDLMDMERHDIFALLNGVANMEERVIGVINKCDRKDTKSEDWAFDLLANDPSHARYLKEGWYGLRNRRTAEQDISNAERDKLEEEFFARAEWKHINHEKLGRHQLKKALVKMLNKHMRSTIPELLPEIQKKLNKCKADIDRLGEARDNGLAQFRIINKIATSHSGKAEAGLNGYYDQLNDKQFSRKRIRDDLDIFYVKMVASGLLKPFSTDVEDAKIIGNTPEHDWAKQILNVPIYSWIDEEIRRFRGKEAPGKVNPAVEKSLWKKQTTNWTRIAAEVLGRVDQTVESVNSALFEDVCPDGDLRLKLRGWLQNDFQKASEAAKCELQHLLDDEREAHLFTLHPTKVQKQQVYREARIAAITATRAAMQPQINLPQAAEPPLNVNNISGNLIIDSIIYRDAQINSILETHDGLRAHYEVALYRFMDNFALQVVERHLLGPEGPLRLFTSEYLTPKLWGEENKAQLNALGEEDPGKAEERRLLRADERRLEEGRKRVVSFGMV